jgi:SSS family solute:Na+ symporter
MSWLDYLVFVVYMGAVLYIGWYFYRRNRNQEDYFVGGRDMGSLHIGLSVVATDVGGGFSIGLGGLGFIMGIAGSWMLFTGLVGAWLSAVFLIPKVMKQGKEQQLLTFPQMLRASYGARIAMIAGIISGLGYLGFSASQLLAGAKLAVGAFPTLDLQTALLIMGVLAVSYTVMGGLKAVIYTDTFQWMILLIGLIGVGIPLGYVYVGGLEGLKASLEPDMLRLSAIRPIQLVNWFFTIVPIWFIGMTLYQRIYACRDERTARRAWYLAGFFEWPLMAFMGVLLGMFARVAADQGAFADLGYGSAEDMDAELGLPLLLRTILPGGLLGLMLAAYFSAIMSTADSCMMAASGNIMTDIAGMDERRHPLKAVRMCQWGTLGVGVLAIMLALYMENVLSLMLHSYAFMVSGLFVPVLAHLYVPRAKAAAAGAAMIGGGGSTLFLTLADTPLPWGLDPIIPGIMVSALSFAGTQFLSKSQHHGLSDAQ